MSVSATAHVGSKPNLFGLDRAALRHHLAAHGAPSFHASQVFAWIYARDELDPATWTDLPKALRARLALESVVHPGRIARRAHAADGTVKFEIELPGGGAVECVHMTHGARVTLCLSSQVGCALGCHFCLTARMGLVRHLDAGEIVGQVALLRRETSLDRTRFNVVFMGMGEPLHNYESLRKAISLLTDPHGFAMSRRRITVSTSGLAPAIERLAEEPVRPRLAVSLNATTDALRDRLMPVNRKYPIARLLAACRRFAQAAGESFSLEYVLLAGVNDSDEDVRRLARLAHGLPAKINLIPFNEVPGRLPYRAPTRERVEAIRDTLLESGRRASVRWSRGADARAACGQLALTPTIETPGPSRSTP